MRSSATVLSTLFGFFGAMAGTANADVLNMGGTRNPDGSWTGLASLETVPVGNPGNAGELSGSSAGGYGFDRICGAVDYTYNIGKFEVTAGQYCEFLNAVAKTDTYGLYDPNMWSDPTGCMIQRSGTPGNYEYTVAPEWANRPVNWVTYWAACRFANWLHNGQPTGVQDASTTERGAYTLDGYTGGGGLTIPRNANWKWAVPNEDEWYKAAYHKNDGATGNYWDYPTSNDADPSNVVTDPDPGNNANYYDLYGNGNGALSIGSPYYRTVVGEFENSETPYGTFDQAGNVWEWHESAGYASSRGIRGGTFDDAIDNLLASFRVFAPADEPSPNIGFRVVQAAGAEPPVVDTFAINDGAETTNSRIVTLNNACSSDPTEYLASESPDFAGATWQPYSTAPAFTLSTGKGVKTVYFKVRNVAGESAPVSDTITLSVSKLDFDEDGDVDGADWDTFEACASGPGIPHNGAPVCLVADLDVDADVDQSDFAVFQRCYSGEDQPPAEGCDRIEPAQPWVVLFAVNNGAPDTTRRTVTLDNVCANGPSEYMASESPDFAGASWEPYWVRPSFTLSTGKGVKTVYFKVRNVAGETAPVSDTITLRLSPLDFDEDGDVDGTDWDTFETCASGPGIPHGGAAACLAADRDVDNDVDQSDFAVFQRCYGGQNVPADADCAG